MAWQTEMTTIVRYMLDDAASVQFDDATLQKLIAVAAQFVITEMTFNNTFDVDVTVPSITPDPTDRTAPSPTRDNFFIDLVCLKACCVVDRGKAATAAKNAVSFKDYQVAGDLTGVAKARAELLKVGYCPAYEDAKVAYMAGQNRVAGAAIVSPFRLAYGGNSVWPARDWYSYFQS